VISVAVVVITVSITQDFPVRREEMMEFSHLGKVCIVVGLCLAAFGLFLVAGGKMPLSWRLPGDIVMKGKNVTVYFPVATCLIVSVILSFIFYLFRGR